MTTLHRSLFEQLAGEILQLFHDAPPGALGVLARLERAAPHELAILLERPQRAHPRDGLVDHVAPLGALARRDPAEGHPALVDAHEAHQLAEHDEAPPRVVVARRVVAIGGMTAAHDDAVGAALERLDDEERIDASGTRQADDAHVARHVQAAGAGKVGAGVRAPVADEGDYARLERGRFGRRHGRAGRHLPAHLACLTRAHVVTRPPARVGLNLPPEIAARAAAGGPHLRDRHAHLVEDPERIAQAVGHALQHRAARSAPCRCAA